MVFGSWSAQAQTGTSLPSEKNDASLALDDLEAFVDGIVASHMAQRVAGVQVAIVKDGTPLLIKGYGLAQTLPNRPVDPHHTLFRLASISKTFTWLALLQLAERGALKLDDPINQHLPKDLAIADEGFRRPIRIIDLMNHTAGFEEAGPLEHPKDDSQLQSLRDALREAPHRAWEPGRLFVYSNYGADLAGAIVAFVSHLDFETYIERNILEPLGMANTTFREPYGDRAPSDLPAPMPKALATARADPLEWTGRTFEKSPLMRMTAAAPSGGASSTAADMARYMVALLDPLALARAGVLTPTSHATLVEESFRSAPGLRGLHHGFFNDPPGIRHVLGHQSLGHGGNMPHFHAHLSMFPGLRLGIFVAVNSNSGVPLTGALREHVLWRYFRPVVAPQAALGDGAAPVLQDFAGTYRSMRRPHKRLDALFALDSVLELKAGPGACLSFLKANGDSTCFLRLERDLFQQAGGDARLAFLRDPQGHVSHAVGAIEGERVKFWQTAFWLRAWLVIGIVTTGGLFWDTERRRQSGAVRSAWERRLDALMTLTAASWLLFYVAGTAWQLFHGHAAYQDYPQPLLVVGQALLVAAVVATVLAILALPMMWRRTRWSLKSRLAHTFALLLLLSLMAALDQWNVIGFHF